MTAFRDLVDGRDRRTQPTTLGSPGATRRSPGLDAIRVDAQAHRSRPATPAPLPACGRYHAGVGGRADGRGLRHLRYDVAAAAALQRLRRLVSIGNRWIGFDHSPVFRFQSSWTIGLAIAAWSRSPPTPRELQHAGTSHDGPERLLGARVTASFFDVLGVRPVLGRVFTADEDQPGSPQSRRAEPGLWSRRFGADRSACWEHGSPSIGVRARSSA